MQKTNEQKEFYDVFISYRHDTGFYMAQVIYDRLLHNGYSVFMDKTMHSGKYEEMIKSAVLKSRNFIMILFPTDLDNCEKEGDWLVKEATWATSVNGINIIPVMCDNFSWPEKELPKALELVSKNQGVIVHKDYSLDRDLDALCNQFLTNTTPNRPNISTEDFFKNNLNQQGEFVVTAVDMAFHSGAKWFTDPKSNALLKEIVQLKKPVRILINTVNSAESIAKHMRDDDIIYVPFSQARDKWISFAQKHEDCLEVRECEIPFIHIYHKIELTNPANGKKQGKQHVKYYAYDNTRLDNAFEHEISDYSKYYAVYNDEFEFLWKNSSPLK